MQLDDQFLKLAAKRPMLTVRVSDILPRSGINAEVKIRDLTSGEVLDATQAAVARRKAVLTSLPKEYIGYFLDDPKFLADSQTVEELARAVRDGADPSKPAFSSADVMHKALTRDELAALYAYFEKARALSADLPTVDAHSTDAIARAGVENPEATTAVLMRTPHYLVCEMVLALGGRVVAKEELAQMQAAASEEPAQ